MMRPAKSLKLVLTLAALSGMPVLAQFGGPGDGPPPGGPPMESRPVYQEPSAQQTLKRLTKDLKLTDEQKLKIKPILEDEQKRMATAADSEAKMASIEENAWSQIRSLLTDAQHKKFEAFTEKMAKRRARAARMAEEDDGPPPGPPSSGGPPPF
jgi:Spy/CpxP family protein refolding chaperone